jgi:hypothetical protein
VWVAALVVALVGAAWAGEAFEGKMSFEMTAKQAGGQPMKMDYTVKKNAIRMDMKMAGMENYTLIFPAEKKMCTVMPAQKMVMEMAIPDAPPVGVEVKKPEIAKTGKTDKIAFKSEGTVLTLVKADEAGAKTYDAEQWQVKMEKMTSELWVAKDFAPLAGFGEAFKSMQKNPSMAWADAANMGGFPYKIVTKDAEGNVVSEMTLVSVDTKSPDEALFKVPEDYKKMEMPKMPAPAKE